MDKITKDDVKRCLDDVGIAKVNLEAIWKELHGTYASKTYIKEKARTVIRCCEFLVDICSES